MKTHSSHSPLPLLGGLSAEQFLADYWQKKPLLVRNAIADFGPQLDKAAILEFSQHEDVESRFVSMADGLWEFRHGPFSKKQIRSWKSPWSVLVQGVNLVLPFGDQLVRQFNFIPYARLDDLMVSYATEGGGVGPHFDNYDVFLLQGSGHRRWRIGRQKDKTLVDGLPLRILKNFTPSHDWILGPGDMLYLPPSWAHDGVAVDGDCMTWSIGFRAAPAQELAEQFLIYLQDSINIDGIYQDPDLKFTSHPGEIDAQMIDRVTATLQRIRWERKDVVDFLGSMLTEPKTHVYFTPPEKPLSASRFKAALEKSGVRLDPRTQLLFTASKFFLNGEPISVPATWRKAIRTLADTRRLSPATDNSTDSKIAELIYDWYLDGFLHPDS